MNLRTKLISAFGLLAVIMLAITITGYREANNLASALYEVGVVRLPSIQGLDQITSAMTALKGSAQTILVEGVSDSTITKQLDAQRNAWLQADAGWKLYEPLPQSAEESAKWRAFVPAFTAWKNDYEAVTTLVVEGHHQKDPSMLARAREQSRTRTATLEEHAESLLAEITAINSNIATAAKNQSIGSVQDVHRVQTIMIISSGIGLISAGFLGLFLGRIVTQPLEQMVHALGRIGRGDFSTSVPVRSKDEIGQIAIAANSMVAALRITEGRLQDVSDNLPNGVIYQVVREPNAKMRFLYISSGIERLMGVSAEAVLRDSSVFRDLIVEEDQALLDSAMRTSQNDFSVLNINIRMRREDGAIRWMRKTASPRRLEDGRTVWGGILVDITELKQTEEALRASEERFSRAFNLSPVRMGIIRQKDAVILDLSTRWLRDMGFAREEIVGHSLFTLKEWVGEEEHPKFRKLLDECKPVRDLEGISSTKTGEKRYTVLSAEPIELAGETCMLWASNDITDRKRSEEALQKSESLFRATFENATVGVCVTSTDGKFMSVNRTFCDLLGYSKEELEEKDFNDVTYEEDRYKVSAFVETAAAEPGQSGHFEKRYVHKEGRLIWAYVSRALINGPTGQQYLISHVQDITERKKSENDLRNSEERFRQLVENIQEVFWIRDVEGDRLLYISPGYEKVWGRSSESLYQSPLAWLDAIYPADRDRIRQAASLKQTRGEYIEEYRIVRPDGSVRWIRESAGPVHDSAGNIYRIVGVAEDITERQQIEEQFRQAQKMEAIGRLAGGVAHDFNNLLTIILGYSQLMEAQLQSNDSYRTYVEEIRRSGERAAVLTRQLLTFSRRQVLHTQLLDINESVIGVTKMLQRIAGEDISIQLNLHPSPVMVHADAGMLDQMLMNLAVNSRDAMPNGGNLIIETTPRVITELDTIAIPGSAAGNYVCLTVRDTGCGIDPENLPRVFEPFFTTKEPGKGTGLGLATVFGIVKQHRGAILVSSEVSRGTTFQIFLPVSGDETRAVKKKAALVAPPGGEETVLLVEDDPSVHQFMRTVLTDYGYQVLDAYSGLEALELWEQHTGRVRLLLTDMVLPAGINGRDLAARLLMRDPDLKVIFTSGYNPEMVNQKMDLQAGQIFLQKPCLPFQLLETVRHCLDS